MTVAIIWPVLVDFLIILDLTGSLISKHSSPHLDLTGSLISKHSSPHLDLTGSLISKHSSPHFCSTAC